MFVFQDPKVNYDTKYNTIMPNCVLVNNYRASEIAKEGVVSLQVCSICICKVFVDTNINVKG